MLGPSSESADPFPGVAPRIVGRVTGRDVTIELLLASPRHRYDGRPADGARPFGQGERESELPGRVEIRAGLGIVGDRYFAKPAHRGASVTFFDVGQLETAAQELGAVAFDPARTRRNVIVRGMPVDTLRGALFSLDSGAGAVLFRGNRPANPCAWMDHELAPGAFAALRGHGGMRCEPLTDGELTLGPAVFEVVQPS